MLHSCPRIAYSGRLSHRGGNALKPQDPLPPLGGNIYVFPQVFGIDGWTEPFENTTGNVFVRLVIRSGIRATVDASVSYGGVALDKIVGYEPTVLGGLATYIYGKKDLPIGTANIVVTTPNANAGLAIMNVGSLRSFTAIGGSAAYTSDGGATGLQLNAPTQPGNDMAMVAACCGYATQNMRPVVLEPYYKDRPPLVEMYDVTEIAEVTSSDGVWKMVAVFGACKTQQLPYPDSYQGTLTAFRWNTGVRTYGSATMEVVGSTP